MPSITTITYKDSEALKEIDTKSWILSLQH